MPCYRPLQAYRSSGAIVFDRPRSGGEPLRLPCGQCIGCRLERSRQWALRCLHEASCYEKNVFATLTYDEEHLPADGSLDLPEFQRFMKRLRKARTDKVRFFIAASMVGRQVVRTITRSCLIVIFRTRSGGAVVERIRCIGRRSWRGCGLSVCHP